MGDRLTSARDGPDDGAGASDDAVDRLGLIGEELFMAEKTASVHVSRILAKLGVSSRVEAATAAQRLGIVG
jgi:hypothetical protein